MTIFIYGVGAIGGTLAAKLVIAGHEVAGIARGAQLEAIRANGLLLRTPDGDQRVRFPVFADPASAGIGPGDQVLLTMKGQDTAAALADLAAAGVTEQAVFCCQNGVDNERQALRYFANVYGVTVMLPGTYIEPGTVACFGVPKAGIFDIGRYPSGIDDVAQEMVDRLNGAGFAAFAMEQVMESKYGKLITNLGNVLDAALGPGSRNLPVADQAREEGRMVLRAAGITFRAVGAGSGDPRRESLLRDGAIPGADRVGSSSAQSLRRGAGSIETEWLNGEIVLLARLHGIEAPINQYLAELGRRLIRERIPAGGIAPETVARELSERMGT